MASNGLVANPSKTVFMMLNSKQKENELPKKIKVGDHGIKVCQTPWGSDGQ